jgi:hypothetical protein
MYVGTVDTLEVTNSLITNAVGGHEIKTGALNNVILNDRISTKAGPRAMRSTTSTGRTSTSRTPLFRRARARTQALPFTLVRGTPSTVP